MPDQSVNGSPAADRSKFYYGWVVVAACTLMVGITYGLMYSYSVFFKPLADYFSWDRATVSLVYSASLIIRGAIAIGIGWLADKYGAAKIMVFCGIMTGLGLILSGHVPSLWQFFLTYGVIEATGLSGAFGIGTAVVSRWFVRNRGLALGITATGSGLGTLLIVPLNERLVDMFQWSQAFVICGAAAGVIMTASAFLLRPAPRPEASSEDNPVPAGKTPDNAASPQTGLTLGKALGDTKMILLLASFLFFFFSVQLIMVHLVNYATDMGITPLVAAGFISIIGAVSVAGRLASGAGADKIGIHNTLMLTSIFLVVSLVCLIFGKALWTLYLFAAIFGLTYGAEIPQIPLYISRYFGTKSMAALLGLALFVTNIGGALGPWVAGRIFDTTGSYQWAFIAGAAAGLLSLVLVLVLKRQSRAAQ